MVSIYWKDPETSEWEWKEIHGPSIHVEVKDGSLVVSRAREYGNSLVCIIARGKWKYVEADD